MTTFVIFWSALIALLCFGLGTVCKTLGAMFMALMSTLLEMLMVLFYTGIGVGVLYVCKTVVYQIAYGRLEDLSGGLICAYVGLAVIVIFAFTYGVQLLAMLAELIAIILSYLVLIFMGVGDLFEVGFEYFLGVIMKRVEKC